MTRTAAAGRLLVAAQFALLAKPMLEERGPREQHADYGEYAKRVRRFIPGLF